MQWQHRSNQRDHAGRRLSRRRPHHHRARQDAGSRRRRSAGARLAHRAVRLGLQAVAQGRRIHRGPRDLRRRRAARPPHARPALRGLYPVALRPLRRLPARRYPDVPRNLQPDRLEQAGRLCGISAGAGKLPAAGARRHRGQPGAAVARHHRHVGACGSLRQPRGAAAGSRAGARDRRRAGRARRRPGAEGRSATTTSMSPIPTRRG